MLVSFVVRLAVEELDRGEIAGEVQVVESGRRIAVRNQAELIRAFRAGNSPPVEEEPGCASAPESGRPGPVR